VLRLHNLHLIQTTSPHVMDLDTGVPARGLHGEAYRGHIFWDELFVFPLFNLRMPEITCALLRYRYRRLSEARRAAREAGYRGAMYPWQSGSNGREESQRLHLNPHSGNWLPHNSRLQRHINVAVAYNVWQHYQTTRDTEFLAFYGAEMIFEIVVDARFVGVGIGVVILVRPHDAENLIALQVIAPGGQAGPETGMFARLGYPFEYETIPHNIDYYLQRTCHGSTLSGVVHSWVLARSDRSGAWSLFMEALESDVADIQGGTTKEGIHTGAMSGTVDLMQRCFTGIETRNDVLWLNPCLPRGLRGLCLNIYYRGHTLDLEVTPTAIRLSTTPCREEAINVGIGSAIHRIAAGEVHEFHF
jgi:trehalose/maltose hydrolase-like predicted phosphorylase